MTPMEGPDRPSLRRRPTGASDLLICFATRRRRGRLRSSSTVKGGTQSPAIFPSIRKPSSSSLDAPPAEPSSPKVSCIGQVRVKTARRRRKKKKKKNTDPRSKDATSTASASNGRACFPSRHQSWVHLPLGNLCHGLNCFRPCEKEKRAPPLPPSSSPRCCSCSCSCGACCERSRRKRARMCACRAAFARCWLMEVEEREQEVEMEEEGREVVVVVRERSRRGMRELELLADELEKGEFKIPPAEEEEREAEPACVPPKNALLLMRCRSDPTRMNSLAAPRLDDSNASRNAGSVVEEEEGREEREFREVVVEENARKSAKIGSGKGETEEKDRALPPPLPPPTRKNAGEEEEKENRGDLMEEARKREGVEEKGGEKEERRRSFKREGGGAVVARRSTSYREGRRSSFSTEGEARRSSFEKEGRRRWSFSSEKDARRGEAKGVGAVAAKEGEGEKTGELPDCLLLMMYEPKLSMEVSKETWVCPADFVRRRRQQRRQQQDDNLDGVKGQVIEETSNPAGEVEKNEPSIDPTPPEASINPISTPPLSTPSPRPQVPSSLQLEPQKAVSAGNNAVESAAYGPFALMRCKSEPARSSASGHISLDGCFWRSRHQPVGATGIGF